MGRTKLPTTYTRYFALGMQLSLHSSQRFLSTLGAVMLEKKKAYKSAFLVTFVVSLILHICPEFLGCMVCVECQECSQIGLLRMGTS